MQFIYLDYSTTTPVAASVRESMLPFLSDFYGHPSSNHWYGRAAQEAIEDARSNVACLLGCHPAEIVFTSGGTESVNLGLLGVARAVTRNIPDFTPHFITSSLEHSCVRQCVQQLEREGWQVSYIGCDSEGVVRIDELEKTIRPNTRMISIIHANHRIGTIQPLEQIAELCRERDILLHSDAAQSVGKIECHVDRLGVDLLSFSGHKLYAPKGIGALYIRMGVPIEAILYGEGCEAGIRPGTANVPHIVGLGQAAKLAQAGLKNSFDHLSGLRDRFHLQLESMIGRPIRVHGLEAERVPGILSFEMPGVCAEEMQQRLPEICFGPSIARHGRTHGSVSNSTHSAIGLSMQQSSNTLLISLGWTTSEDELHRALHLIASAYEALSEV
ncbi:MAG: cysteine desulfurase [Planctomycetales bacterium]|nr:cysteine desulfurase [Planctomycetales bacterium]